MNEIVQLPDRVNLAFLKQDGLRPVTVSFGGKDLSEYQFKAEIVPPSGEPVALSIDDTDAKDGNVVISLSVESAEDLPVGEGSTWYLQWIKPGEGEAPPEEVITVMTGDVTIL